MCGCLDVWIYQFMYEFKEYTHVVDMSIQVMRSLVGLKHVCHHNLTHTHLRIILFFNKKNISRKIFSLFYIPFSWKNNAHNLILEFD